MMVVQKKISFTLFPQCAETYIVRSDIAAEITDQ